MYVYANDCGGSIYPRVYKNVLSKLEAL